MVPKNRSVDNSLGNCLYAAWEVLRVVSPIRDRPNWGEGEVEENFSSFLIFVEFIAPSTMYALDGKRFLSDVT
jgi:hypothetical protein